MDPIRTGGPVKCPCGWAGEVPTAGEGESFTCPGCGVYLRRAPEHLPPPDPPVNPSGEAATGSPAEVGPALNPHPSGRMAAWDWTRQKLQQVASFIRATFAFYWASRRDLRIGARRWLLQYLPALEDPDRVRREIRVPLREDERVSFEELAWQIQLPGRCIICGSRGTGETVRVGRELSDPFPLLATPLAVAFLALFLGWWYQSLLLFFVLLPIGILAGYALRRSECLVVKFERCTRHVKSEKTPDLELWHGDALLWTGAREVRQAYFGTLVEEAIPEEPDAPYVPPELTPSPPAETLALADDVPESSRIRHESAERLSTSESENDLFGSVNESLDPDTHRAPPSGGSDAHSP